MGIGSTRFGGGNVVLQQFAKRTLAAAILLITVDESTVRWDYQ